MNIIEDFITPNNKCRPGKISAKKWIVIHETGNKSSTANASNHSIYLKNLAKHNNTYLSWHYTVDDTEIYHHIPDNEIAWHAGDGQKAGGGNMAGIAIEICVNNNSNFDKSVDNAAYLTGYLLNKHHLTINSVKQHYDFSKKNCPQTIREKNLWSNFLKRCEYYKDQLKSVV